MKMCKKFEFPKLYNFFHWIRNNFFLQSSFSRKVDFVTVSQYWTRSKFAKITTQNLGKFTLYSFGRSRATYASDRHLVQVIDSHRLLHDLSKFLIHLTAVVVPWVSVEKSWSIAMVARYASIFPAISRTLEHVDCAFARFTFVRIFFFFARLILKILICAFSRKLVRCKICYRFD